MMLDDRARVEAVFQFGHGVREEELEGLGDPLEDPSGRVHDAAVEHCITTGGSYCDNAQWSKLQTSCCCFWNLSKLQTNCCKWFS